jgi:hypothetical protein
VDQPKHASQQPYQDKLDVRHTSSHIPASGAVATNGNPPPSSPRMPPSAEDVTGTQPDAILPAGLDDSSKSGDNNASALQNALSWAEIVKMLLTPPKSDTESSTAKHHKFHSSRSYLRSEIKRGPFYPQPPNPTKERIGEFNKHRNESNHRFKASREMQIGSGSGDGKQTGGSPDDSGTGAQPGNPRSGTDVKNNADGSNSTDGTDNTDDTNATDADSDDSDDGGVSILEKMLSPPDSKPQSNQQDIRTFHYHYAPTQRSGPFIPQQPDPSKESKGEFNCRRNKINLRRKFPSTSQPSSDNDGDDEKDDEPRDSSPDNSLDDADTGAPPSTPDANKSTTTTHFAPLDTPRPITRSKSQLRAPDTATSPTTTTTTPSPSQPLKRKRDDTNTPTKGARIS